MNSSEMNEETRVFRPKGKTQKLMIGSAVVTIAIIVGMVAISTFSYIRFGDLMDALPSGVLLSGIAVGITLIAVMVYQAFYWRKYAIVVGRTYIAREGLPHLVDRKQRIAFTEIIKVTYGDRNVLKVVPRTGPALAANLRGLEGDPSDLIEALREKLPNQRFERDLDSKIFESSRMSRFGFGIFLVVMLLLAFSIGSIFLRDPILSRIAWSELGSIGEGIRVRAIETDDDGNVWVAGEGSEGDDASQVVLTRIQTNGETESLELSSVPLLKGALDEMDQPPFAIESLVVDPAGRPWLHLRGGNSVYLLDSEEWTEIPATFGELEFAITDLVRAGDYLWARVPDRNGLFRINRSTLETTAMGPLQWDQGETTLELSPRSLRGSSKNGAVVFGAFSTGSAGLLVLDGDGSIFFTTPVLEAPSDATWSARSAMVDNQGHIHVIYVSDEVCVAARRMVKVGTRLKDAAWVWRDLVYEADCDIGPRFDEIQIDALGRVWIRPQEGDVLVFEAASGDGNRSDVSHLARYSSDNSGYNDGMLAMGSEGQVFAVRRWDPKFVQLDAQGSEIPSPLPDAVAWILQYPFVLQFAAILVLIPASIVFSRRNFGR